MWNNLSYSLRPDHIFLVKYDSGGSHQWDVIFDGGGAGMPSQAAAMALDSGGNIAIAGKVPEGPSGYDFVTLKYDTDGNNEWKRAWDGQLSGDDDRAAGIAVDTGWTISSSQAQPGQAVRMTISPPSNTPPTAILTGPAVNFTTEPLF